MPFIKFGKTTIIFLPNRQSSEGALALCGYLVFLVTIITLVISPVWVPFVFITSLFNNFVEQLSYDGWIIDPISNFIILSIGFILFSPICFFVVIPLYVGIINFCLYLFRQVKNLFCESLISYQNQQKILISTKVLIALWLLSLLILPLIAFCTQIGIKNFPGTITRSYAENVAFYKFKQNPFDQLKLLDLGKKYSLNLNSEDRKFMLDLTGRRYKKFLSKYNSLSIDYNNGTIYTNLGERSSIILFYDHLEKLENKYHLKINMNEKLMIVDFSKTIAKRHRKTEDEVLSDKEILKFLEYSFISNISEDRALKKITSFTSDELKLFGKFQPNKFWLPRFSRHRSIELTKLYKHDLSNEQRKVFYEDYCNVVVNSIYRAYHVESGYLPGKNDSRMIKSEAKNPQGNPDFNDCRKFLLDKGYQLSDGAMFTYFYKP